MTALVLDHEYGSGDILAAFDSDNNIRGIGSSYAAPFGTYSDQILHDITLRSNSEGDFSSSNFFNLAYFIASSAFSAFSAYSAAAASAVLSASFCLSSTILV
jgi:hypothetical protein